MGKLIDRAKRYTVRQLLHSNNIHLAIVYHELYRISVVEGNGLTDKEQRYLDQRLSILKRIMDDLSGLASHIQKGL